MLKLCSRVRRLAVQRSTSVLCKRLSDEFDTQKSPACCVCLQALCKARGRSKLLTARMTSHRSKYASRPASWTACK